MSVHCLWRCYRVNRTGRDSNAPLCCRRQEIIVRGRVSRQRWGVVGGWKAGKWWGEGQTQRKEEALGFELAGGRHYQHNTQDLWWCPPTNTAYLWWCPPPPPPPFSHCSPSELCGDRCREESFLLVCGPLRPKQPAGSSVQSHSLEKVGKFHMCETSHQRWE